MQNSVEATGLSVVKVTPAIGGTVVSLSDPAQNALAPFLYIPWSTIAAILTCIYTSCLLGDWLWKKFKLWRKRNQ